MPTSHPAAHVRVGPRVSLAAALTLGVIASSGATLTINASVAPAGFVPGQPMSEPALTGTLSPSTDPFPCIGEGCIPQPTTPPAPPAGGATSDPGFGQATGAGCSIANIGGCVTSAINDFFRDVVTEALNPLLDLLSTTLLTTPPPESLPRVGELWNQSWEILLICYGLLVMIAGVLLMAHESLQARYSIKEIAPRLVIGFLAGAVSLFLATKAIAVANALAAAVMGGGLDPDAVGATLKTLVATSLDSGGIFLIFLGIFLVVALIVLLITYVVRVAITIILLAGAPLALMCHALPQTEGVAYWWWKAFGGCLAIQVTQSLALITGLRVFLDPGGFSPFGPTRSGLVNLLVALALLYVLIKIPFWILSSLRNGGRRSLVGTVARAYVIGKALG